MLDYCLYMVISCLLGCISFKYQVKTIIMNIYSFTQPWVLEKLIFYGLLEIAKILFIILLGFVVDKSNFTLSCCIGMSLYLICSTIIFKHSHSYQVFCFWLITFLLHPQALQMSLALFLSCYVLSESKHITSIFTHLSFPLCLVATSANIYLVVFNIFMLVCNATSIHWSKINNLFKTVTFSFDFYKL